MSCQLLVRRQEEQHVVFGLGSMARSFWPPSSWPWGYHGSWVVSTNQQLLYFLPPQRIYSVWNTLALTKEEIDGYFASQEIVSRLHPWKRIMGFKPFGALWGEGVQLRVSVPIVRDTSARVLLPSVVFLPSQGLITSCPWEHSGISLKQWF